MTTSRLVARIACGLCPKPGGRARLLGTAELLAGEEGEAVAVLGITTREARLAETYSRRLDGLDYEFHPDAAPGERRWTDPPPLPDEAAAELAYERSDWHAGSFELDADHTGEAHPFWCPKHGYLEVEEAVLADAARRSGGRPRLLFAQRPDTLRSMVSE